MKNMNSRKVTLVLLSIILILCATIGGTLAWLMDSTPSVTNTFTVGKVEITLKESPLNADGTYGQPAEGTSNKYQLIPGKTYKKDPVVAVDETSEDCWLFVKFVEVGDPYAYIDYTSTLNETNGWTQGTGTIPDNVWYREVKKTDTVRSWNLLVDDKIQIEDTVTAGNMTNAANAKLVWTAYAVQTAYDATTFTAEQAWDISLDGALDNP